LDRNSIIRHNNTPKLVKKGRQISNGPGYI